jgi:predicted dehydrogenase
MSLVPNVNNIRLAMLGMVDGNGHPYSWSAIVNGRYDRETMEQCGFPVIPKYLGAEPPEALGIPGAQVTHVWCDDPEDARRISKAAYIQNVVDRPEDVIGLVDAVVIPTDRGWEHVDRARPFVEAGLPVFIDKPMVDNQRDLLQFIAWQKSGRAILSTSAMRYSKEFNAVKQRLAEVGQPRLITITTPKSWERYGIHALEAVYPLLPPGGWLSAAHTGDAKANVVHARHRDGVEVVVAAIDDMYGAFCCMGVHGTKGSTTERFQDTFFAFKAQLVAFIDYLRTGRLPFDFQETVELMKLVIAGTLSREQSSRMVLLSEIQP